MMLAMFQTRWTSLDYPKAFFLYTAATKLADALTVLGVWHLCWFLRFQLELLPITKGQPDFGYYSRVSLPLVLVFVAVFHIVGTYRSDRVPFGFQALRKIMQSSILGTLIFIAILYFQRSLDYSRLYLVLFSAMLVLGLVTSRGLLSIAWGYVQRTQIKKLRVLLVGSGKLLMLYWSNLQNKKPYPVEWVGRLGEPDPSWTEVPHLGSEQDLLDILGTKHIDSVVISYSTSHETNYSKILQQLSDKLVTVKVIPDFGKYNTFVYRAEEEWGVPLLLFNESPISQSDWFFKRLLDIVGSIFLIALFSPIYLIAAIGTKLSSKGPIFYSQERLGADERVFTLYKFRTMKIDAEKETGAVWAAETDPRTTAFGKWLRRTSLDEIPQFFNVLKGNMSLVGPRPERPVFVNKFEREIPKYQLRHKVKSGITGWAQVNGFRGNTPLDQRIKYDLFYIGHWSLLFDIKILLMTLFKGFVHRHAY